MENLELLTNGLKRVIIVKNSGSEVITEYTWKKK